MQEHPPHGHPCEAVGLSEIALRFGISVQYARVMHATPRRDSERLPRRDWTVSGRPAWCWTGTIVPWAAQVGRAIKHTEEGGRSDG